MRPLLIERNLLRRPLRERPLSERNLLQRPLPVMLLSARDMLSKQRLHDWQLRA